MTEHSTPSRTRTQQACDLIWNIMMDRHGAEKSAVSGALNAISGFARTGDEALANFQADLERLALPPAETAQQLQAEPSAQQPAGPLPVSTIDHILSQMPPIGPDPKSIYSQPRDPGANYAAEAQRLVDDLR